MTKQEIIAELRSLTNEETFPKLMTFSEVFNELSSYVSESGNYSKAWRLMSLYKQLLDCEVRLCDFVPCDVSGVPLEEPLPFKCSTEAQKQCSQELEPCECAALDTQYNEAQKNVIFEGWEVSQNKRDDFFIYVFNKELDIEIEFDTNDDEIEILLEVSKRSFFAPEPIQSLADLTGATKENPIKLK